MAISNELLSSTLFSIRDGEVDELFQKVAFLDHCKRAGGIEFEDGGIKIQRPLSVAEHSTITSLPTGYEPVSLAVNDVLQPAIYQWADFAAPIVITKKEELENQSEKAIVKIVEARMRSVMGMLRREINKQILAGSSTTLTTLNSLNGFGAGVASFEGFIEEGAPAPGTQTRTVGGLAKNTLNVQGWYNRAGTGGGAFGTNGIRVMSELWSQMNQRAPMGQTDVILASEAGFANYKRALFQNERYIDEKTLDGGRMSLMFAGSPVEADISMPLNGGGGNVYTMYFLNFDTLKLIMHPDADFAVSDFEHISGTTARAATLYWKGQLIADHLGSQGVLYNGDTY